MTEQPKKPMTLVEKAEEDLRDVERVLENIGQAICDIPGSSATHGRIDLALEQVREAIRGCWMMEA